MSKLQALIPTPHPGPTPALSPLRGEGDRLAVLSHVLTLSPSHVLCPIVSASEEKPSEGGEGGAVAGNETVARLCQRAEAGKFLVEAQPKAPARIHGERAE